LRLRIPISHFINRLRSWTGQDFYSALEVWADSRETCTTLGERPHLG